MCKRIEEMTDDEVMDFVFAAMRSGGSFQTILGSVPIRLNSPMIPESIRRIGIIPIINSAHMAL
nr:MAG TPA: hypothetical protein [Caudoviricetes sp.]